MSSHLSDGGEVSMQVIILTVPVAALAGRKEFIAAGDRTAVGLARVNSLQVLLEGQFVAESR